MKLTESQAESFELLYANISNALLYAEDLKRSKRPELVESMAPVITKLNWLKTALSLRLPPERRKMAREKDHLFYDEIMRRATHLNDKGRDALENYVKTIT